MVLESWSSVPRAESSAGSSSSAPTSPSSGRAAKQPSLPPLPLTTDISRIIDHLQTGDLVFVEHALFSLSRLLEELGNSETPAEEQARSARLQRRVNQLLETLVEAFTALYRGHQRGVPVTTVINLLRLCSNVLEKVLARADLSAAVSAKTIAAYVHALLPVRRGPPTMAEFALLEGLEGQQNSKRLRRLTRLLSRHASLILRRPTSIIANRLDRGHLFVALLREATSLLTTHLKPHFAFLVGQISQLNASLKDYLERKYGGEGQAEENAAPPVDFERLNLDLLIYEANRTSSEILNRDFDEQYEPIITRLIENLETLLNSLIRYSASTGRCLLNHFVLVPHLEESIPFKYVCGQLEAAGQLPEGFGVAQVRVLDGLFYVEEGAEAMDGVIGGNEVLDGLLLPENPQQPNFNRRGPRQGVNPLAANQHGNNLEEEDDSFFSDDDEDFVKKEEEDPECVAARETLLKLVMTSSRYGWAWPLFGVGGQVRVVGDDYGQPRVQQ